MLLRHNRTKTYGTFRVLEIMIERRHQDLMQESVALFSDCEKYRYKLTRTWDPARPGVTYLMLNPSTADEMKNDPTIERCQRRAIAMGYGRMIMRQPVSV